MPVELEQVTEGLYFNHSGNLLRIKEDHYTVITALRHELDPIPIISSDLLRLGFHTVQGAQGQYERYSDAGKRLTLKARTGNRWVVLIDAEPVLCYIHELQRLWFSLFNEALRFWGDHPRPVPPIKYQIVPAEKKNVMITPPNGTTCRYDSGATYKEENIPYQGQEFYLTFDCLYLVRAKPSFAIWRVTSKEPLFEFRNRRWGLVLVAGRSVTDSETKAAGHWLKSHLLLNGFSG